MTRISDLIRSLRSDRNVSAAQLADALGMAVGDYSLIEDGGKPLSIELLYRIAEALQLDPSNVIGIYMQSERDRRRQIA